MKLIVVISAVIVVVAANTEQYRAQCISELNIQQGTIEKFSKCVFGHESLILKCHSQVT
jgi:hypothetical protein